MANRTDELFQSYYDKGKAQLDEQYSRRRQQDDQTLAALGDAIDRGAQTAGEQYRQRIDDAPTQLREQLDLNDLDERVQRRQLAENMANAGLTDSGLNRTQQTALSLQRGNADAASRRSSEEYVRAAQNAIDQILADAAQQKAQQEVNARSTTDTWYQNALDSLAGSARSAASQDYHAEQQAAADIAKAKLAEETARYKAAMEAATKQSDNSEARSKYAQALMSTSKGGYSEKNAWAAAYARYPTGDEKTNTYYTAYNNAMNDGYSEQQAEAIAEAAVNGTDPTATLAKMKAKEIVGTNSLYNENFFERIINDYSSNRPQTIYNRVTAALSKNEDYASASSAEKRYITAVALGNTVRENYKDIAQREKLMRSLADKFTDDEYLAMAEAAGL